VGKLVGALCGRSSLFVRLRGRIVETVRDIPPRAIKVRRIYDAPDRADGYRVLVDRLWPRGVKRTPWLFDEWAKDAAPSHELRRWYGHDPARYAEFARRYRAELGHPPVADCVTHLAQLARARPVTFLTATKDVDHSGAAVLSQVVEGARL
jgi:uncharacterized protein YeaO (DUF488 family)